MASRVQTFQQRPWDGGLNTAKDPALLTPNELVEAQNLIFDTSGSRRSRGGFGLWDYIAVSVQAGSAGTTRTLVVNVNSGFSFTAGDEISLRTTSGYDADYDIKKVTIDSVDNVTYSPNVAITYTLPASLTETLAANANIRIGKWGGNAIIAMHDYWRFSGGSKLQQTVAVDNQGNFFQYASDGSKSAISVDGAVSLSTPLTRCSFAVLAEKLVIAFAGSNTPLIYDGTNPIRNIKNTDWEDNDVTGTNPVPNLENLQEHNSRIYATVSNQPDRIYYSDINNPERWNGEGDSGAVEVAVGDGDSSGFSAIMPSFKGRIIVSKNNQLYQILGFAPLHTVEKISDGIGSNSHASGVSIDQDDITFISQRGIHSVSATDAYGDFAGAYLSKDIQPTFNAFDLSRTQFFDGEYVPKISSVAYAMTEEGEQFNSVIYLYNIEGKQWYYWNSSDEDFRITSMISYQLNNQKEILLGLPSGRILRYAEDNLYDFVNQSIEYRVKTGIIYPDNDPTKIKGFKQLGFLYKTARGTADFDITFTVDKFDSQIDITQEAENDLLGTDLILGASVLGVAEILLPENRSVDGYGFGCQILLTSSGFTEIYGYTIDFEPAGDQREVIR